MTTDYPVDVDVITPAHFERPQLALRVVLAIVLGAIGITAGWLACALFGVLPLVAAIAISSVGRDRFMTEVAPRVWRPLEWLLQFSAYMLLLVDRFPAGAEHPTRTEVRFTGHPTVASALLRLLTSIPSGFVLMCIWFVSAILWLVAAGAVLLGWPIPASIHAFQRGVLRWQARLVAYHASLVNVYPPFSFDSSVHDHDESFPAARAH